LENIYIYIYTQGNIYILARFLRTKDKGQGGRVGRIEL